MSPKTTAPRMVDGGDSPDSLGNNVVSCNGWTDNNVISDSESESAQNRPIFSAETLGRFWAKVDQNGPIPVGRPELGNCWIWTANVVRGYGQFTYPVYGEKRRQRHVYAHRFSFELEYGPLPGPEVKACHHCDTPLCVRPSHMFPGSQADNLTDARRKGRLIDGLAARKLSDDAYREILAAPHTLGMGQALAAKFGVSETTISRIRCRKQGITFHRSRQPLQAPQAPPQQQPRVFHIGDSVLEQVPAIQVEIRGVLHGDA